MRCKVVTPRELREVYQAEVRSFPFLHWAAEDQGVAQPALKAASSPETCELPGFSRAQRFRPLSWPRARAA